MFHSSTFNSNHQTVRAFFKRALLFFAPLITILILFEFALFRAGESWPISYVVRTQAQLGNDHSLYARWFFSSQFNLYKYDMTQLKRAEILIHGTSRVMQVRDFMFHPLEASFYNAGGMIRSVFDLLTFAHMVQRNVLPKPRVVIIGVDPWWVKQEDPHLNWLDQNSLRDEVYFLSAHVEAARQFIRTRTFPWHALLVGSPSPSLYYGYHAIGVHAHQCGAGFRYDGSLQLCAETIRESIKDPRHKRRRTPSILERITKNTMEFTAPAHIDPSRIAVFIESVSLLKSMGVEVYVFLPPFSAEARAALESSTTLSAWWHPYTQDLPAQLRAAGLFCLPLSIPTNDGFDDTYMYDGYHPSEVYMAYIVKQILQQAPPHSFLSQLDADSLDALLARDRISPLSFEIPPGQFPR